MTFDSESISAFVSLSRDRNPLHTDDVYARRTPFGQVVVHGVAALLSALGSWMAGRAFRLVEIRAEFRRALLAGVTYDLRVDPASDPAILRIWQGDQVQTEIHVRAFEDSPEAWTHSSRHHAARSVARDLRPGALGTIQADDYTIGSLKELAGFGIQPDQIPLCQLDALCWASYFVGMEYPGRDALLSQLKIIFNEASCLPGAPFRAQVDCRFDPRLSLARITGSGSGVKHLELRAFWRPVPVDVSISEVAARVAERRRFEGKRALVLGSSRGFGRVVAIALALEGAEVILHGRSASRELDETLADLRSHRAIGRPVVADLAEGGAQDVVSAIGEPLDIVVLSAFPPATAAGFREKVGREHIRFVESALTMSVEPLWELLPLTRVGATVVAISTTYVIRPPRHFSHYVAAKAALEGFMRAIAVEWPDRQCVIFRAPRMLTDQTNVPFDLEPKAAPLDIAVTLLDALADRRASEGVWEIDVPAM